MRCVVYCLFLAMICTSLHSQKLERPFAIQYKSGYLALTDSLQVGLLTMPKKYHRLDDYEIIVSGDAAFVNFFKSTRDKAAKKLGTNFKHDNIYTDFNQQKEYHQIQSFYSDNQRLLVERNFPSVQFDLFRDSVQILGYTCYKAVPKNSGYFYSSVWYTPAIPYPISKHGFSGLPGAVLAHETVSHGIKIVSIASSINPEHRVLQKPTKGYPISGKEYAEMMNRAIPENVKAAFTRQ